MHQRKQALKIYKEASKANWERSHNKTQKKKRKATRSKTTKKAK